MRLTHIFIILTLIGASCGAVLAHEESLPVPAILPDSPFYFIKVVIRGIGSFFAFGDEAKLRNDLAIAEEKLLEAHALFGKGKVDLAERALEKYQKLTQKAEERLAKVKSEEKDGAKEIEKEIQASIAKHLDILEEVLEKAPEAARNGLENAIENSSKVLEKLEDEIEVEFVNLPKGGRQDQDFTVVWKVEADKEPVVTHTAVHYDYISHSGDFGEDIGPAQSGYPKLTSEFAKKESKVPGNFTAKITPEKAGVLYLRAHAIIDGNNYWSEEKQIKIAEAIRLEASELEQELKEFLKIEDQLKFGEEKPVEMPAAPKTPAKETFVIEGDDSGLYPAEIKIKKGSPAEITFKVRSQGTYFGGLDFRGDPYFNTGLIAPDGQKTVTFTADQTFEYRSYWPASNVLKATGRIIVQ